MAEVNKPKMPPVPEAPAPPAEAAERVKKEDSAGTTRREFNWLALAWTFFIWLLLGRAIAYLFVPLFISTLSCPGCQEEIDAVGIWRCGCGFHPHRERHILAGRCPKCGKATGHVNCPRCQCTILLW